MFISDIPVYDGVNIVFNNSVVNLSIYVSKTCETSRALLSTELNGLNNKLDRNRMTWEKYVVVTTKLLKMVYSALVDKHCCSYLLMIN